jgi:hypothetical protein
MANYQDSITYTVYRSGKHWALPTDEGKLYASREKVNLPEFERYLRTEIYGASLARLALPAPRNASGISRLDVACHTSGKQCRERGLGREIETRCADYQQPAMESADTAQKQGLLH